MLCSDELDAGAGGERRLPVRPFRWTRLAVPIPIGTNCRAIRRAVGGRADPIPTLPCEQGRKSERRITRLRLASGRQPGWVRFFAPGQYGNEDEMSRPITNPDEVDACEYPGSNKVLNDSDATDPPLLRGMYRAETTNDYCKRESL